MSDKVVVPCLQCLLQTIGIPTVPCKSPSDFMKESIHYAIGKLNYALQTLGHSKMSLTVSTKKHPNTFAHSAHFLLAVHSIEGKPPLCFTSNCHWTDLELEAITPTDGFLKHVIRMAVFQLNVEFMKFYNIYCSSHSLPSTQATQATQVTKTYSLATHKVSPRLTKLADLY